MQLSFVLRSFRCVTPSFKCSISGRQSPLRSPKPSALLQRLNIHVKALAPEAIMAAENDMRVVIIGGNAGGMSCATRLRRLNEHCRITVVEKGPWISSATCGIPYALSGVIAEEAKLHVQSKEKIHAWFNIDVLTGTEALSIDRKERNVSIGELDDDGKLIDGTTCTISYDKLVLAPGAEPTFPPIDGIRSCNVFTLRSIADLRKLKDFLATRRVRHVAVIGGGFIGLEAAENLVGLGMNVTMVEYMPQVFASVDADIAGMLHRELRRNGVELILNARIAEIDEEHIHLENGEQILADAVILATGIHAGTTLAESAELAVSRAGIQVEETLQTSDPDIYAIGDAIQTLNSVNGKTEPLALAGPANRHGRLVADHICGKAVKYHGHVGTSVCKVFGLTVASVGLCVRELAKSDLHFEYVTVHPLDHAGYYPGAHPVTLRVAFDTETGKMLGAQGIGDKGVDKRIDVLATAIQAGMSIRELTDLELAYAPPYGSAKDAVNMAGFVGSNVLDGVVRILHARDIPSPLENGHTNGHATKQPNLQLVDVRSPEEYCQAHLPGAVNIPLGDLRKRCHELLATAPTLVYCKVGYRGYLAYRILKQRGFNDVFNLDGGFKLVEEGDFKHLVANGLLDQNGRIGMY